MRAASFEETLITLQDGFQITFYANETYSYPEDELAFDESTTETDVYDEVIRTWTGIIPSPTNSSDWMGI